MLEVINFKSNNAYINLYVYMFYIGIARRRQWHPTPVFLLGEYHGQRSLVGYSPWSLKESHMTEVTWQQQHVSWVLSQWTL